MFNSSDEFTPASLFRLKDVVKRNKPIVFWIGAGASQWAGLPSWHECARKMRQVFAKAVAGFPDGDARSSIDARQYPEVFELCKRADRPLYNRTLIELLSSPTPEPVYEQLIQGLKSLAPVQVVTTNVDLALEQNLGQIDVVEHSDLERCSECVISRSAFVAKLHGSVSSIGSTVFATSDYAEIKTDRSYLAAIKALFNASSVVFLGYGLRDKYLLDLLAEIAGEHALYGAGPHFHLTDSPIASSNGIYSLGYSSTHHKDHRAALTVFNLIKQGRSHAAVELSSTPASTIPEEKKSGFFISYFAPSGTHTSGQSLELARPGGLDKISAVVGLGFVQWELPSSETVAFHDLAVGLTCFDRVYMPLNSLGPLHGRATSEVFWELMDSGAIQFIDIVHHPFYVAAADSIIGDVGVARIQDPNQQETRSSMSEVRKMLKPIPGREEIAEPLIESVGRRILQFNDAEKLGLPAMVRDALLMPRVSSLLGFSEYIVSNRIPRWLAYPTLRLAHLVQTALICDRLGIRASRVPFGGAALLSAAFGVNTGQQNVYDYASYVMAGAFGSNTSSYFEQNPRQLLNLLRFRATSEAEMLRREISDRLKTNDGAEFSTAIEGGLSRAIPISVIQAARNKFSTLMKAANPERLVNAVWADANTGDPSLRLWRDRSRELLLAEAKSRGVNGESLCLCESGDRMRDCCLRPLKA